MDDQPGLRDLHRLKVIGVGAPVAFLAVFEICRIGLIEAHLAPPASNVVAAAFGIAAALAFGLLIFLHLERAQRDIVRRNRDLAYVDRVAAAVQGELDADVLVERALAAIAESTGAVEARATVHSLDADSEPSREIEISAGAGSDDALSPPERLLDVALTTPSGPIGRVQLRIPASRATDLPSEDAVGRGARQLGAAVQIAQLVADMQRRKLEGHVLYQALLQISNQLPLPEVLGSIVAGARDRLRADESRLCLARTVLEAFDLDRDLSAQLSGGIVCEIPDEATPAPADPSAHRCPIGDEAGFAATLRTTVWSPGELLGELWIARRTGESFTERDRRYLMTLAGITAIAITAARLRAREQQGAILAERDRIARELHDSLAQVLGSNHLRLRMLLARPEVSDRRRIAGELEDLAEVNEEAYRDVREAILGLREASRTQGLIEALRIYLDKYAQQSGLTVELDSSLEGEPSLPAASEIQVIRVIQEALTNVRKHARASHARVRLASAEPGMMTIVVEDDGRGFDPDAAPDSRDGGYGLQTMRERMQLAGGSLRVDSRVGGGTRVVAVVPDGSRLRRPGVLADHR